MSLSGKAAACLNDLQTGALCDWDSLWIALDNELLPSNYATTQLSEFRARKLQVGERMKYYYADL